MLNWFWLLVEAVHIRWGRWEGTAIKCDLCRQLSWNGYLYDDGHWACLSCASSGTETTRPFQNRDKEPIHVHWMLLEHVGDGHKTECPVCKDGLLTMMRSSETGELLEYDACTLCGQIVIFDDIEFVRKAYP